MEGSRDGVCLYYTKALVREAVVLSWKIIESIVVLSLSASERFPRTWKTEVRVGVVKDRRKKSPGSDIG